MSGLVTLRESSRQLLADFAAAGGEVIFAGERPSFVDALPGEVSGFGRDIPFEREAILSTVGPVLVELTGKDSEKIFAQMRRDGGLRYLMLLSTDPDNVITVEARLPAGEATILDCRTGGEKPLATGPNGDVILTFLPSEEKLFRIDTAKAQGEAISQQNYSAPVSLGEPLSYSLDEPNVLVLDTARLSVNGGEWSEPGEILLLDRAMRDAIGLPWRGGDMLQPWYQEKHADTLPQGTGSYSLEFRFTAEALPVGPVWLAAEHLERMAVSVNGIPLGEPEGWWVDPCLQKLPVPAETFRLGENKILLTGEYRYDSGFETIFLLGAFGVRLEGEEQLRLPEICDYSRGVRKIAGGVCVKGPSPVLTSLPERLKLGSLADQGLPFYSGKVTLGFTLPQGARRGKLLLEEFGASCVNVSAGNSKGLLLSRPYEVELDAPKNGLAELELVLTRRNSFGPFHALPAVQFSYGPDSFLLHDTDGYALLCNGLPVSPQWVEEEKM